jgi:hypothetical protein
MCEVDGTSFRLGGYKTQAARSAGERCRMYARFPALSVCASGTLLPRTSLCPWLLAVIARIAYIAAEVALVAAPSL